MMTQQERERLIPTILRIDGENVEAFSIGEAAVYMGKTYAGLKHILKVLEKQDNPIKQYQHDYGSRKQFLLKRDLDRLMEAKAIEE